MRKVNNERVVLMAHSMGNRCVQYFLQWVVTNYDRSWIDENIHAFLALGPPFLGAPKSVRAVISGDCMGLEMFLTDEESRTMARGSAALPWLFPVQEELFPDTIARVFDSSQPQIQMAPSKEKISRSSRDKVSRSKALDVYEERDVGKLLEQTAPVSFYLTQTPAMIQPKQFSCQLVNKHLTQSGFLELFEIFDQLLSKQSFVLEDF
jgi:hypothetical protein